MTAPPRWCANCAGPAVARLAARVGPVTLATLERATAGQPGATRAELLTVADVAAQLYVDPYTVRRWLKAGRLDGYLIGRTWRVPPGAVAAFLHQTRAVRDAESTTGR